jgi:hypothetical protein
MKPDAESSHIHTWRRAGHTEAALVWHKTMILFSYHADQCRELPENAETAYVIDQTALKKLVCI